MGNKSTSKCEIIMAESRRHAQQAQRGTLSEMTAQFEANNQGEPPPKGQGSSSSNDITESRSIMTESNGELGPRSMASSDKMNRGAPNHSAGDVLSDARDLY